jgi:hypothetical protein
VKREGGGRGRNGAVNHYVVKKESNTTTNPFDGTLLITTLFRFRSHLVIVK